MKLTFVDPTYDQYIIDYIKTKEQCKKCIVFRFYSLLMYGAPLDNLIPLPQVMNLLFTTMEGDEYSKDFDTAYAYQLLTHQPSFVDLMQIMGSIQYTEEVFVISNYTHENVSPIIDSLIKFIQERYSIRPYIVNAVEDINELAVCDFQSHEGYINLIRDIDRFKMQYYTKEQLESDVM